MTVNRESNARHLFTNAMFQKRTDIKPPEALSLSEWANKYAVLSRKPVNFVLLPIRMALWMQSQIRMSRKSLS